MAEKDLDLANKEKDLASWAAEVIRMQQELEWEREKQGKAQVEATEAVKRRGK